MFLFWTGKIWKNLKLKSVKIKNFRLILSIKCGGKKITGKCWKFLKKFSLRKKNKENLQEKLWKFKKYTQRIFSLNYKKKSKHFKKYFLELWKKKIKKHSKKIFLKKILLNIFRKKFSSFFFTQSFYCAIRKTFSCFFSSPWQFPMHVCVTEISKKKKKILRVFMLWKF